MSDPHWAEIKHGENCRCCTGTGDNVRIDDGTSGSTEIANLPDD